MSNDQSNATMDSYRKHFLHEAGHAIALDCLAVHPVCVLLRMADDPRAIHGSVTPPERTELSLPEFMFFKMCGPASHLFLAGVHFETELNIFRSDFTSVLKQFPVLRTSDSQIGQTLVACRSFMESFCRTWVEEQSGAIESFADALQAARAGAQHHELRGSELDAAIITARASRTNLDELRAAIHLQFERSWISAASFVPEPWLEYYVGCVRVSEQELL